MILGKYTFEINCELFTKELLESVSVLAKKCQGIIAAKTNKGYGRPSDGSMAIFPKTRVKIIIVNRGRKTPQPTPIIVCLYLTKISLRERK